jgi:hypothetical protein
LKSPHLSPPGKKAQVRSLQMKDKKIMSVKHFIEAPVAIFL